MLAFLQSQPLQTPPCIQAFRRVHPHTPHASCSCLPHRCPWQFFTVTISTAGENMAMLMNTVMLTGYMLKSAAERFRLCSALGVDGSSSGSGGALQQQQQQQLGASSGLGAAPTGAVVGSSGSSPVVASSSSSSSSTSGAGGILDSEQYAPGVQKSRVQVGCGILAVHLHLWMRGAEFGGQRGADCQPIWWAYMSWSISSTRMESLSAHQAHFQRLGQRFKVARQA